MSARPRLSHLFAVAATALAFSASAAPAALAAQASPGATLPEQILVPPTTGFFNWNRVPNWLFETTQFLWPDATVRGFWNIDGASLGVGPGAALTIDPIGGLPLTPAADTPVPPGSLYGQWRELSQDRLWDDTAVAVNGRNWTLEAGRNDVLVERNEDLTPLRSNTARGLERHQLAVTRDGLRVIQSDGYRGGKPLRVRVLDDRLRGVAMLPSFDLLAPAVTKRGRLLLISKDRIVSVGREGSVRQGRWPGGPRRVAAAQWTSAATTPTARGTAVIFGRRGAKSDTTRRPLFIGTIDDVGAIAGARSLDQIGVPWPAACLGRRVSRDLVGLWTGPSSTPIVSIRCTPAIGYPNVAVAFELDPSLRFRALLFAGGGGDGDHRLLGPLPDGRIGVVGVPSGGTSDAIGAHLGAYALPGAIAPARGRVLRLRAGRQPGEALVRLECRRPPGTLCSGIVTVRASAGGAVLGWAPYALAGRPGWSPAIFDRRVALRAGDPAHTSASGYTLPAEAVASLTPLPASIDRSAPQPPAS